MSEEPIHDSSFLKIDELRLDKECLGQAALYFDYATRLAEARAVADEAKTALELCEAALSMRIRKSPKKFQLENVTEGGIKATIAQHEEFREAQTFHLKKLRKVALLQAAVSALDQRKRMLTLLVDLYGLKYFADPRVTASPDVRTHIDDGDKRETRSVGRLKKGKQNEREDGDE